MNGWYATQQIEGREAVDLFGNLSEVTFGASECLDLWVRVGGAEDSVKSLKDGNVIEIISHCEGLVEV